jgi:hypothetical protein
MEKHECQMSLAWRFSFSVTELYIHTQMDGNFNNAIFIKSSKDWQDFEGEEVTYYKYIFIREINNEKERD